MLQWNTTISDKSGGVTLPAYSVYFITEMMYRFSQALSNLYEHYPY